MEQMVGSDNAAARKLTHARHAAEIFEQHVSAALSDGPTTIQPLDGEMTESSMPIDRSASDRNRPLSSVISQVLVAYSVEFDNEFELQMDRRGFPGSRLSLVIWARLIRFIPEDGITVDELRAQSSRAIAQVKHELGCLERWGFIGLHDQLTAEGASMSSHRPAVGRERRKGWGSGRAIRGDWTACLTGKGLTAWKVWPPLFAEIDGRWEARFGKQHIGRIRQLLEALGQQVKGDSKWKGGLPLPGLLSQALNAFAKEFDRRSIVPLWLCANAIRVLGKAPMSVADLPRLTGSSPETCGIGWQLKPFVVVESDAKRGRGKLARLSARGLEAQRDYHRVVREIEAEWAAQLGEAQFQQLHGLLNAMFAAPAGKQPPIALGLVPPPGVARAGAPAPSLGRRAVGPAARQRMRDMIAQTESFIRDPAQALPHYPLWDMNRGFGP